MARMASVCGALGDARLSAWITITRHLQQEDKRGEDRREEVKHEERERGEDKVEMEDEERRGEEKAEKRCKIEMK